MRTSSRDVQLSEAAAAAPESEAEAAADAAAAAEVSAATMAFVQELSKEVSGGPIELPSYPEAAMRVQRALSDPRADAAFIAKVVGNEAVLAGRVVSMANSAALATGSPVTDVRAAVQRLGFDALRSAVFSFAVGQLRKAAAFREIEKPLNVLWQQSVAIAAAALLLSKKMQRGAPDTAMLAGLMSGVGKLYILTRAQKYPALFGDPASYDGVVTSWHASVARSILENWGLADELVDAVAGYEEAHIEQRSKLSLADLVAVAQLLTQLGESPDVLQAALAGDCAAVRVGITAANCTELMADIKAEVESLRASMGG